LLCDLIFGFSYLISRFNNRIRHRIRIVLPSTPSIGGNIVTAREKKNHQAFERGLPSTPSIGRIVVNRRK